jgi:hypothetical protein
VGKPPWNGICSGASVGTFFFERWPVIHRNFITCKIHQLSENYLGGGKCRYKLFAHTRLLYAVTVTSVFVEPYDKQACDGTLRACRWVQCWIVISNYCHLQAGAGASRIE